jgi:hypothetical protein
MEKSYLGQEVKKLGFGLMRLPMKGDEVYIEQMKEMVDLFLEKGFTYFDTSPVYVMGKSESAAREAIIKRYPREKFQIATKLPMWMINEKEDMEKYFNISLNALGVDYIDFYLLHGMSANSSDRFPTSNAEKAEQFGAWEFLKQKKAEGKVKHIGFSFHDTAEVLDTFLNNHPEVEFVQLQINYADWEDEIIQSKKCFEVAREHGIPVTVMEPVKGGTLVNMRPEIKEIFDGANPNASLASWAIRFAASLEGVVMVLSGMSDMAQLKDNVGYMADFKVISEEEGEVINRVVQELQNIELIKCTGCRYCIDGCQSKINIQAIFSIVNEYRMYEDLSYSKRRYTNLVKAFGKASDCLTCGSCESHCPQKLKIMNYLKEAATLFEPVCRL